MIKSFSILAKSLMAVVLLINASELRPQTPGKGSLGLLALGGAGLMAWRQRQAKIR